VKVQLNGPSTGSGQAAMDDEARLAEIAGDLLAGESENPKSEIPNPKSDPGAPGEAP